MNPPLRKPWQEEEGEFSGPTTITYEFLEEPVQRKKVDLTIPVYRCQGSGMVRVEISVAPDGHVLSADVKGAIEGNRTGFALQTQPLLLPLSSRFRIDINAPSRQRAIITYSFMAQ